MVRKKIRTKWRLAREIPTSLIEITPGLNGKLYAYPIIRSNENIFQKDWRL